MSTFVRAVIVEFETHELSYMTETNHIEAKITCGAKCWISLIVSSRSVESSLR